jgi:DNA-directed RNA polymerase specialized sigma24 family protein
MGSDYRPTASHHHHDNDDDNDNGPTSATNDRTSTATACPCSPTAQRRYVDLLVLQQQRTSESASLWPSREWRSSVHRCRAKSRVSVEEVDTLWRNKRYSVDASAVVEQAETGDELRDALVHPPVSYRSVVVLHDAEGWTTSEIATMLGIGLPAAKQRLRRGRMMLVNALTRREERRVANKGVPLSRWEARQQVSEYLDHEVGTDERAVLEAHLTRCVTCPPLYQALVGEKAALGALHDPDSVVPPSSSGGSAQGPAWATGALDWPRVMMTSRACQERRRVTPAIFSAGVMTTKEERS